MRIAGVQMDVQLGEVPRNLARIREALAGAAGQGASLVIFPECAVTGYCFDSLEEALPFAETIPGPATGNVSAACAEHGVFAVFGMLERDGESGVFNAAVLVGPEGVIGSYRKVHLPFLGVDRFATYGDRAFAVHEAGAVRVGMAICYDSAFPEASRVMTLAGADLIALPTNWPPGAECIAAHTINTRAMENNVYFAAVNRVGTERGFTFIGSSSICDPGGTTIAAAGPDEETVLFAEVDPERARMKRVERVPGLHAIDRLADRRPEMYGALVEPHTLPRPGRAG